MMVLEKIEEEEETEIVDVGEYETPKPTKPLSGVKRDITDIQELMKSEAAIRLLLGELDRLEYEVRRLSQFQDKFHEVNRERAVLVESNKKVNALEVLFITCLTVGAALIALNPRFDSNLFWLGVILVIGGLISRVIKK